MRVSPSLVAGCRLPSSVPSRPSKPRVGGSNPPRRIRKSPLRRGFSFRWSRSYEQGVWLPPPIMRAEPPPGPPPLVLPPLAVTPPQLAD
jgi:hypothetical protein